MLQRFTWAVALAVGLALAAAPEVSAEPRYSADGSQVFWFVQISDTHVSTFFNSDYDDRLLWALGEGVQTVGPWFVVVTGDLTDSTDGVVYGTGPHLVEWQEYRSLLAQAGVAEDFYFDLPGNHDAYGDGQLRFYRQNALSPSAYLSTQPYWAVDMPYGQFNFFGAADPANDGLQWPWDNDQFTDEEMNELETNLAWLGEADFAMAFGHHDFAGVANSERFLTILLAAGATYYAHGHEHDLGARLDSDGVLRFRIDSLGQSTDNHFAVYALDDGALSTTAVSGASPWPLIVVTAPVAARYDFTGRNAEDRSGRLPDGRLGQRARADETPVDNPHAPGVPRQCAQAPLRALVFDKGGVVSVRFRIDGGEWRPMSERGGAPEQWRARFDATPLADGLHALSVEAQGTQTVAETIQFRVVDLPCDIGEEDADEPLEQGRVRRLFNETDGDAPDGDVPDGDIPDGDVSDGDLPDGDEDFETADGDVGDGDEPTPADGDEIPDGDEEASPPDATDGDAPGDGDPIIEVPDGDHNSIIPPETGDDGAGSGGCAATTAAPWAWALFAALAMARGRRKRQASGEI
ncbi:MAG: hypothetical protein C4523_03340 [Myxococcales bacterium]|nr:MAG: hypothetical protein C4523_03340 [Myxococcales bacterium]